MVNEEASVVLGHQSLKALNPRRGYETRAVDRLPAEILCIIFKMLYVLVRFGFIDDFGICQGHKFLVDNYPEHGGPTGKDCQCYNKPWISKWEERDDLTSPSLFPYSIANVCSFWGAVASSIPVFWTRIIVFLDDPDPARNITTYLGRSGQLPIDSIAVIRKPSILVENDPSEGGKVKALMEALRPELARSATLSISTLHSESLPSIMDDFTGVTHKPSGIHLNSLLYGSPKSHLPTGMILNDGFRVPALTSLSLTGWNFVQFCRANISEYSPGELPVRSITISHLRSEDGGDRPFDMESIYRRLHYLLNLEKLKFVDVHLKRRRKHQREQLRNSHPLDVCSVDFEDCSPSVIDECCDLVQGSFKSASIIRCSLYGTSTEWMSYAFNLEIIGVSDVGMFSEVFRGFDAFNLCIRQSPGLTDDDLRVLTSLDKSESALPFMPSLRSIHLQNCPNISISALSELAAFRHSNAVQRLLQKGFNEDDEDTLEGMDGPPLRSISLAGSSPTISAVEKQAMKSYFCPRPV